MSVPRFSVIMPIYNRSHSLKGAVDSILAQGFQDFEIILVDDGSTDDSFAVAASYGGQVQVYQQENAGPGAARNLGIEKARGDYIAFLDSDDRWYPWTLSTYEQAICEYDEPSLLIGCPGSGDAMEDSGGGSQKLDTQVFPDYFASSNLAISVVGCAFVVKRECIVRGGGFNPGRMNAEDLDLLMRLGTEPGFVWVKGPPVMVYVHSQDSEISQFEQSFTGLSHMLNEEKQKQYPGGRGREVQRKTLLCRVMRSNSLNLIKLGQHTMAWNIFKETFFWQLTRFRFKYFLGFFVMFVLKRKRKVS